MFIVHGTKLLRKEAGWVVEFCPSCRQPEPFQMTAVFSVRHLYWLSTGGPTLVRHEIACSVCGTRMACNAERYTSIEKKRPADLAALISTTMPNIPELLGDRLATEKLIRENLGALDPIVRKQFIFEPFQFLNWNLENYQSFGKTDGPSTLGCLATIGIGVLLVVALIYVPPPHKDNVALILFFLGVIGVIYTLAQSYFIPHRFVRRFLLPNLIRALKPLAPSALELESVLQHCRTLHLQIGARLKIHQLLAAMR